VAGTRVRDEERGSFTKGKESRGKRSEGVAPEGEHGVATSASATHELLKHWWYSEADAFKAG